MLYALAMGACSMTYAVTFGHAILYAYRIGLCHTKVRRLPSIGLVPRATSLWDLGPGFTTTILQQEVLHLLLGHMCNLLR